MPKNAFASHPYLLGFEQLQSLLERTERSDGDAYPPYNIEQSSETAYRITVAVAGFAVNDLSVTVEGPQLIVNGQQGKSGAGEMLHKGIASRQFKRMFVLADCVEVLGATLENGLLHMDLVRVDVEKVTINIPIKWEN